MDSCLDRDSKRNCALRGFARMNLTFDSPYSWSRLECTVAEAFSLDFESLFSFYNLEPLGYLLSLDKIQFFDKIRVLVFCTLDWRVITRCSLQYVCLMQLKFLVLTNLRFHGSISYSNSPTHVALWANLSQISSCILIAVQRLQWRLYLIQTRCCQASQAR